MCSLTTLTPTRLRVGDLEDTECSQLEEKAWSRASAPTFPCSGAPTVKATTSTQPAGKAPDGNPNLPVLLLPGQSFCNSAEQTSERHRSKSHPPNYFHLSHLDRQKRRGGCPWALRAAFQKLSHLSAESGARDMSHSCAHCGTQTLPIWARITKTYTFPLP